MNKQETSPAEAGRVEVFNFHLQENPVRVQVINKEPWFVAKDVCEILGISKHRDVISRLDEDERGSVVVDTLGGRQQMAAITESGLYALIFQSRKPEAKKFRRWVTAEVLPSIRKKGYYCHRKDGAEYMDIRDVPYQEKNFRGVNVRFVDLGGELWYSLGDIRNSLGMSHKNYRSARQLNIRQEIARRMWLYGASGPVWFVRELGVRLLMCSRHDDRESVQLTLDFGC